MSSLQYVEFDNAFFFSIKIEYERRNANTNLIEQQFSLNEKSQLPCIMAEWVCKTILLNKHRYPYYNLYI